MSFSDVFRHTVAYLDSCVTLTYSKPCYIQNPGIFGPNIYSLEIYHGIFWHIHNAVSHSHTENPAILRALSRIWAYLGPKAYRESFYLGTFRNI